MNIPLISLSIGTLLCGFMYAAAPAEGEFNQKAEKLFSTNYFFHAWDETDHTRNGEDWSLPPWVKPAPYSGIQISPKLVPAEFPGRIQRAVHASWRALEPAEGTFLSPRSAR